MNTKTEQQVVTSTLRLSTTLNDTFLQGDLITVGNVDFLNFLNQQKVKPMSKSKVSAKDVIRGLIVKGKSDEAILKEVLKKVPESNADKKHCTKYRKELLGEGLIGPELAAVGSREHRDYARTNAAAVKKGPHKEFWKAREAKIKAAEKVAKTTKKKATRKKAA